MNSFVEKCNSIFSATTLHYHEFDNIDAEAAAMHTRAKFKNVKVSVTQM